MEYAVKIKQISNECDNISCLIFRAFLDTIISSFIVIIVFICIVVIDALLWKYDDNDAGTDDSPFLHRLRLCWWRRGMSVIVTVSGLWLLLNLFVCVCLSVCVCVSVCLSRFHSLYLAYYGLDFNQTWWTCWNFSPYWLYQNFIKNRFSVDVIMTSFLFYF